MIMEGAPVAEAAGLPWDTIAKTGAPWLLLFLVLWLFVRYVTKSADQRVKAAQQHAAEVLALMRERASVDAQRADVDRRRADTIDRVADSLDRVLDGLDTVRHLVQEALPAERGR